MLHIQHIKQHNYAISTNCSLRAFSKYNELEIQEIIDGKFDKTDNVIKNAPHTCKLVVADDWKKPYSRQKAAYPLKWVVANKFWPSVAKVDSAYGDRNLVCSCAPIESYTEEALGV